MEVVLRKEPCRRQVIEQVQSNPTKFDMFRLENYDACVGLQAPISIDEVIQPTVIVGGSTILLLCLMEGKMME
jgi:hypothetical protein